VSVGRFTSPDTMVSQVRRNVVDLIGAARPSIADPFLPSKIRERRFDDIRECIGCNICYASNSRGAPLRCTQNPTMGEEWRSGWHPETVPTARQKLGVLIVGAGPAGLEAAQVLGKAGHAVALADSGEPGGRVSRECRLPGLSAWVRVRDWRLLQIGKLANVSLYPGSTMTAADVSGFGADRVFIATGARWRADGIGRHHPLAIEGMGTLPVFTPDDILDGRYPEGRVVIYDDEGYYMAAVIALAIAARGNPVVYVTPDGRAATWSTYTAEQARTHLALIEAGVEIHTLNVLDSLECGAVNLACLYSGRARRLAADAVLLVTGRLPNDALYRELTRDADEPPAHIKRIGDCLQPALIAHAVHSGHRHAREMLADAPWAPARDRLVV
jgi:dimethylamine/trimethylamine dehydrogenase